MARAARKLRRDQPWITADPDAAALAQQMVYLAAAIDAESEYGGGMLAETATAYIATREALMALRPGA
jgi:hypothetical protein